MTDKEIVRRFKYRAPDDTTREIHNEVRGSDLLGTRPHRSQRSV